MNKKEYIAFLNYERNMSPAVRKTFEQLIEEHFDPKPYEFKDLKEGMWVWDDKEQACCQIGFDEDSGQLIYYFYDDGLFNVMGFSDLEFEENRFYPPNKANEE